jgi:hypothetical protein
MTKRMRAGQQGRHARLNNEVARVTYDVAIQYMQTQAINNTMYGYTPNLTGLT